MRNFKFPKSCLVMLSVVFALSIIAILYLFYYSISYATVNAQIEADIVSITPEVSGEILELNVENNSSVKTGEIIAKIDDKIYVEALNKAQNELNKLQSQLNITNDDFNKKNDAAKMAQSTIESAKTQLDNANNDYVRYKIAYKDGSVTKHDLDNAIKNLETARELYKKAQKDLEKNKKELNAVLTKRNSNDEKIKTLTTELEQAKLNLSYTTIVAPINGTLINNNVKLNDVIEEGQTIFTIISNDCYVIAQFDPRVKVAPNQKAIVKVGKNAQKAKVESAALVNDKIEAKIIFTDDISKYNFMPKTEAVVKIKLR